jgi:prevent-host-death family protein
MPRLPYSGSGARSDGADLVVPILAIQVTCGHNDHMRPRVVGARELKVRLGTYLRQVRQGRTLVVTDRGQPVAELRPIAEDTTTDAVFARLEAQGVVTRPTTRLGSFRSIARPGLSLSGAVLDDRHDRF